MKRWVLLGVLFSPAALAAFDPATTAYQMSRDGYSPKVQAANVRKEKLSQQLAEIQGNIVSKQADLAPLPEGSQKRQAVNDEIDSLAQHAEQLKTQVEKAAADVAAALDSLQECQKRGAPVKLFRFCDSDPIFGGMAASQAGDSKLIQLNAINYYLWLGGNVRIPFQLLVSQQANKSDTPTARNDANQAMLLDPDSGYAFRLPLLLIVQPQGGVCDFSSDASGLGHCAFGGTLTGSAKPLTAADGTTKNAVTATARAQLSILFPVLSATDLSNQGYLSIEADTAWSHSNFAPTTPLFIATDAAGKPISFDRNFAFAEVEAKFAINGHLSIAGRYIWPYSGAHNVTTRTAVTVETQL